MVTREEEEEEKVVVGCSAMKISCNLQSPHLIHNQCGGASTSLHSVPGSAVR